MRNGLVKIFDILMFDFSALEIVFPPLFFKGLSSLLLVAPSESLSTDSLLQETQVIRFDIG